MILDTITLFVENNLMTIAGVAGPLVYDYVRRKWPTQKAASLPHDISAILNKVSKMCLKVAELMDRFGPANIIVATSKLNKK